MKLSNLTRLTPDRAGRPTMPASVLLMLVTAFFFVAYNDTFWSKGLEIFSGHMGQLIIFGFAVYFLTLSGFALFSFRFAVKTFLVIILIISAITSYYVDTLGVVVDRDMIQNAVTTTVTESKHLITFGFLSHVAIYGGLPAIAVLGVRVRRQRRLVAALSPVVMLVCGFALSFGLLMTNFKTYSSVLRERKDLIRSFQPGAPVVGAIRYARMVAKAADTETTPIGQDARKGSAYANSDKPVLTIIVAGETARTQNFGLNGYAVQTNPELSQKPVVSFTYVSSCGTATAVSLPCMFSKFGRDQFTYEKGVSTETLLDVLHHAGFAVEWWDNNTGDKGNAARLKTRSFTHTKNADFCPSGECQDGIFLQYLEEYAAGITQDTVLVLHQIGSHGPTYYLRYPEEFEKFKPACRTAEFKNCTPEEITNAYDNTIAYTDHILSQTIDFLSRQDGLVTSLLYVSDHGESLGESGFYLHGLPYFMAPETQTKVPMILWMSEAFQDRFSVRQSCLADKVEAPLSHDNLFHSVLGLLDIQTREYRAKLDFFADCTSPVKVAEK